MRTSQKMMLKVNNKVIYNNINLIIMWIGWPTDKNKNPRFSTFLILNRG